MGNQIKFLIELIGEDLDTITPEKRREADALVDNEADNNINRFNLRNLEAALVALSLRDLRQRRIDKLEDMKKKRLGGDCFVAWDKNPDKDFLRVKTWYKMRHSLAVNPNSHLKANINKEIEVRYSNTVRW